jgi:CRP-like cAMP-binding protein
MTAAAIVSEDQIDKAELLRRMPFFEDFDAARRAHLAAVSRVCLFPEGAEIIREGAEILDYDDGCYLLIDGAVEVRRDSTDGTDGRLLARLGPGEFFGEMALLDNEPRSASVFAVAETLCLVLSRWDFHRQLYGDPDLAVKMLAVLARRLRRTSGAS